MKIRSLRSIAALAALLSLGACDDRKEDAAGAAPQAPPPAVGVTAVNREAVTANHSFIGRVVAVDEVDVRARVQGFLRERLFTEGQVVKAGDPLFLIEQEPYEAQLAQRQAEVARAEAEVANAEVQLSRGRDLLKRNNISEASVDEREAAAGVARAGVLQAKAALRDAEINLSYTKIASPIGGRVGRAAYTVGSLVGPQSNPLAVVVSQDPVYVTFPVSQRELLDVRKRQASGKEGELAVKLRLADGSMYGKAGKFNFLDVKVDPGTDTVAVRTEFPNPDGVLVPGQFAEIVIEESAPEEALVIPQAALQIDQAGPFVLVVGSEKKVEPRRVEVGQAQGSRITVAKGLNEGDLVIVEGGQKVRPGQVVTASPMAPPAGT